MTEQFPNSLDLRIILGVDYEKVRLTAIRSEDLPWLADDGDPYTIQPRSIVESGFLPLVNTSKALGPKLVPKAKAVAEALSSHLKKVLEINCNFRLHLLLEELESGALEQLHAKLKVKDQDKLLESMEPIGSIDWKVSEEVTLEKVAGVDLDGQLDLVGFSHEGSPGSSLALVLKHDLTFPLWIESVTLKHTKEKILEYTLKKELPPAKLTEVGMPAIPVRYYGPISKSDNAIDVELQLRGVSESLTLEAALGLDLPLLEHPPTSFFFDMGSAQCKQMYIGLGKASATTNHTPAYWEAATRTRLENSEANAESFRLPTPEPTQKVIEHFELPEIRKREIDGFDDLQLAAHFARSIQLIARSYYSRQRAVIADFYWAFPNVRERDFSLINRELKRMIEPSILGTAHVVAESDCLRSQFASPLRGLSYEAKSATAKVEKGRKESEALKSNLRAAQAAWADYKSRGFFYRAKEFLTGNRPAVPDGSQLAAHQIPSLEDWHRKFELIACDEALSDYLVFDAGGYTMDVYGSIEGKSGRKIFSKSYRAGSNRITGMIVGKLAEERGVEKSEIDLEEAEILKLQYCSEEPDSQSVLGNICRKVTKDVYENPIQEVMDWLMAHDFTRGIPLILSGGGSRNQHLRTLLSQELEKNGFVSIPVDSGLIYVTLGKVSDANRPDYLLFRQIVSGFNLDDEIPRFSPLTDVIGGLASIALTGTLTEHQS